MAAKPPEAVDAVRGFNRFYTRRIGILDEHHLDSPFSLAEVRVLYELAHAKDATATSVADQLQLDAGYLSRILRRFENQGLLTRTTSGTDSRRSHIALTRKGARAFATFNARSNEEIGRLLAPLGAEERRRLVAAMETIRGLLDPEADRREPYILRDPRPGDLGWVVWRHGAVYAAEYGWDERFEGLVATIVGQFVANFKPKREHCWIAERHGENVGSVFLVEKSKWVAQLRLLFVEPSARGLGIGARLVHECVEAARRLRYKKIVLWTQSELLAARRIYERAGFVITATERHNHFGVELEAETWELVLSS